MNGKEKFLVKEVLELRRKLENNLYYKRENLSEAYEAIEKYIKKKNPDGRFDETLENYAANIKKLIDKMPEYLNLPFPEETKQGKMKKAEENKVKRLKKIISMLEEILGEEIVKEIDRIEFQKFIEESIDDLKKN